MIILLLLYIIMSIMYAILNSYRLSGCSGYKNLIGFNYKNLIVGDLFIIIPALLFIQLGYCFMLGMIYLLKLDKKVFK